jgi:hypothetical protein
MRILRKLFVKTGADISGIYLTAARTPLAAGYPLPHARCYSRFTLILNLRPARIWNANCADDLIR